MTSAESAGRFAFGANWQSFLRLLDDERIARAEEALRSMLRVARLDGLSYLDIGSGSGLSSLAARRLGARVQSFDYDADSVACTRELRHRFFGEDPDWQVGPGDALDEAFVRSLGPFDVVCSWGVLHHTGDMWRGLENALLAVAPGGVLFVALYDDRGGVSDFWRGIKRTCVRLPASLRVPFTALVMAPIELASAVKWTLLGQPGRYLRRWTGYSSKRGMDRWHDYLDWVGGYPYEVARPDKVFRFFRDRGFTLEELVLDPGYCGINQFVFRRDRG